ncbi:nucleoside triphosphate pyrophosphohydrolase [Nitrospira lenta]|uniref:Nucleoside triphosphate pyrophosphohydrolase n=1 Tax=Nitrospira lenta TaxID=1436998 RepID=A0A330L1T2_9BACT|nr:nucleoside triphosphate pyrophosphohydrolase [Nitrospira lenta]SPP63173.1 Nucleoside triphosphate pyrophosphohydrolase [Nitrospira lenta]
MSERFAKLIDLMATLRAPNGCPWDRKQTHESLKPYLLEEAYEVLETIDHRDTAKLKEELGDVLLQVIFHSQIASESGTFTIDDVVDHLAAKLVRRHPHVFGAPDTATKPATGEQVLSQWEEIKRAERQAAGGTQSALDGVPKALPALLRAYQVQARASRVGFDWSHDATGLADVFKKIAEEIGELQAALAAAAAAPSVSHQDDVAGELGDLLFSLVNLARFLKVNPEDALRLSTNRFVDRFTLVESQAAEQQRLLSGMTASELDGLWENAKRRLRESAVQSDSAATAKDIPS